MNLLYSVRWVAKGLVCLGWSLLVTPGLAAAAPAAGGAGPTRLALEQSQFTLNGQPVFLYGLSYYGGLGASEATRRQDFDQMARLGFNWIRVWATWAGFANNVAAVDAEGYAREPFLDVLKTLVAECDRRGVVVDVSLSRGNGVTGPPKLQTHAAHRRAVETLVTALRPWRNWYLDLSNERNIRDQRYTSFEDLKALRQLVRQLDPQRLVTASHAGDISPAELRRYLEEVGLDFLSPHRPRRDGTAAQTKSQTRDYLAAIQALGRRAPVHYQEPFRRGFGGWEPKGSDYIEDLRGALEGGAAGWCFHNGDARGQPDGRPRRSFDLREKGLFEQLDEVEREALPKLRDLLPRAARP